MTTYTFSDLEAVTDGVHALFDGWDDDGTMARALDPTGALVVRLAVHEWIANLVQHAYFRRAPRIELSAEFLDDGLRCVIEDTSEGFDFAQQLGTQRAILNAPAPSERGRGLLMLITCTEDISFQPAGPSQNQRIGFAVRPPHDDVSFATLFRADDLEPDDSLNLADLGDGAAYPADAPSLDTPDS